MKKIVILIVAIAAIGCDSADAENTAGSFKEYTPEPIVEIDLDDMTFEEAFSVQYRAKGVGRTFWWRGNQYLTNLAETVINSNDTWVLNNDDPDDTCYYNKLDECGVCNGPGKVTWFKDKDGDGLGTHLEAIESCQNPNTETYTEVLD